LEGKITKRSKNNGHHLNPRAVARFRIRKRKRGGGEEGGLERRKIAASFCGIPRD